MKIKTYQRIRITVMLILSALFIGAIVYSVKQIRYYLNEADVTTGKVIELGTNWTGGTWTCKVDYDYKGQNYQADIWYHITVDVGDTIYVHINPDTPEQPLSTFWWKIIIIAASVLELLNIIVCVIKVKSVNGGTPFR